MNVSGYELKERAVAPKVIPIRDGKMAELPGVQTYIGTKILHAVPMTRGLYNEFRQWELPVGEHAPDPGYLVQYTDGGKPNVEGFTGYLSWSPKAVFEASYQVVGETQPSAPVTWLDRAKVEFAELEDRLDKLAEFLRTGGGAKLLPIEWSALIEQCKGMERYSAALRGRIARAVG